MTDVVSCPRCGVTGESADPRFHIEFAPVAARMDLTGKIDSGIDWFLDFTCLTCGVKTRASMHGYWSDQHFEYRYDLTREQFEIYEPDEDPLDMNSGTFLGVSENPELIPFIESLVAVLMSTLALAYGGEESS